MVVSNLHWVWILSNIFLGQPTIWWQLPCWFLHSAMLWYLWTQVYYRYMRYIIIWSYNLLLYHINHDVICYCRYNKNLLSSGIERTNNMYGALNIQVSRVVFIHGSIDPWHALGVTSSLGPEAPAIYINGKSLCYNAWFKCTLLLYNYFYFDNQCAT
jgi:hypothetical protein